MNKKDFFVEVLFRLDYTACVSCWGVETGIVTFRNTAPVPAIATAIVDSIRWLLNQDEVKAHLLLKAKENTGLTIQRSVATDTLIYLDMDEPLTRVLLEWDGQRYCLKVNTGSRDFLDLQKLTDDLFNELEITTGEIYDGSNSEGCGVSREPVEYYDL